MRRKCAQLTTVMNMEQNTTNGYCGYITTIKSLRKHSNADRLQCATIFGNNVIVDLSYQEGQKVVYFPVDGQLSEEFASDNNLVRLKDEAGNNVGGYLDADKRNITALKLRGEKSDGLVLPIEVLEKYTDIEKLSDGDKISMLDGHEICRKYIPQSKKRSGNSNFADNKKRNKKEEKEKVSYPFFVEHADTAQLAYNQNAFKEGDTCYITLKLHGTSARTANAVEIAKRKRNLILRKIFKLKDKEIRRFTVVSGTRRTTLRNYSGGYYGSNAFRQKYQDFFKDKLPKGMEVFYEIVGYTEGNQTIMGRCSNKLVKDKEFERQYGKETVFSYGCETGQNDIYVYRMTMANEDGFFVELPWEQVQIECEKMGVKCAPTFEKFIYTTWEDLMRRVEKYYDGADPIGKTHVREGVVVRIDNREKFTAYKHKNFSFKVLEGIIKDTADAPDMEEAEELIDKTDKSFEIDMGTDTV